MQTFISLLRGINVSGQRMIKMDALKGLYADLGLLHIVTYIQSGNVVFQGTLSPQALEEQISTAVKTQFGFDVPVMVKAREELQSVVEKNPMLMGEPKDAAHLHVTFLSDKPSQAAVDKLLEGQYSLDIFEVIDKAVYLYCPNGYGKTKLTNGFFESKLKVTATTRNWKTIGELIKIAEKIG